MSSPSDTRLSGNCTCGAVGYTVADAFAHAPNCPCRTCRRPIAATRKPFAGIPRDRPAPGRGARALGIHGDDLTDNTHCATCGSLLWSVMREDRRVHAARAMLIDRPKIRPSAPIFLGSDDLPQYQEFP